VCEKLLELRVYVHRILIHHVVLQHSVGHGLSKGEERWVVEIFEVWPQITPLDRYQKTLNFLGLDGLLLLRLIWAKFLIFSWKFEYLFLFSVILFVFLGSDLAKHRRPENLMLVCSFY
jgi:hypothetical protein